LVSLARTTVPVPVMSAVRSCDQSAGAVTPVPVNRRTPLLGSIVVTEVPEPTTSRSPCVAPVDVGGTGRWPPLFAGRGGWEHAASATASTGIMIDRLIDMPLSSVYPSVATTYAATDRMVPAVPVFRASLCRTDGPTHSRSYAEAGRGVRGAGGDRARLLERGSRPPLAVGGGGRAEAGPATGPAIRKLLGTSDRKAVDRAIGVLQRRLVLTNAGVAEQQQGWPAIRVDILPRRWKASLRGLPAPEDSRRQLAQAVLGSAGELTAADLAAIFSWQRGDAAAVLHELADAGLA